MKKVSPEIEAKIVAMREAGYTLNVIAANNGCSKPTVDRICKRYGASKGALSQEIINEAKAQLRATISSDGAIQEIAASVVLDTRYHYELIRAKLEEAAGKMEINGSEDVKAAFRSLNSYANALKLSTDAMRSALKMDSSEYVDEATLPTLVVECLSAEEIAEIRRAQEAERSEHYGYAEEEGEEVADYH